MTQRSLGTWIGLVGLPALALFACGGSIDLEKPPSETSAGTGGQSAGGGSSGSPASAGTFLGGSGGNSTKGGTGSENESNMAGEASGNAPGQAGAAPEGSAGAPAVEGDPAIAWLAFDAQPDETRGVYLVSAAQQCFDRITPEGVVAKQPAFAPDGKRVAYAKQKDGIYQIFTRELDRGSEQQITDLPQGATYPTFHPSSMGLAFVTGDPEALRDGVATDSTEMGDLMEVDLKTRTPRLIAARDAKYPYFAPAFSGSDRIFVSNSTMIFAFYYSEAGWGNRRAMTPASVTQEPAPSPDGQWIAYPDTCESTLRLYKHRIDLGSARSCVGRSFDRDSGLIAPDWGAFGVIAAEFVGADHGLTLLDENDFSSRGGIATPKKARNPSWSPADFKRVCRP